MPPFYSIIMPAYNAEKYIGEAIDSVLKQTFTNWELLVVNDGSNDKTETIVSKYIETDSRISLINQENKRLGAARNTGIRNSVGKWIAFLDSDDIWLPQKLEIQHQNISLRPDVDVFVSDGYTYFEDIQHRLYYHFPVIKGFYDGKKLYGEEFVANKIPVLSAVVKKTMVLNVGFQAEEKISFGSEDWDYWLRIALAGGNFFGMDERLFVYRVHSGSMSAQLLTQRLSSISIRMKNFDGELLSSQQINSFRNEISEIYLELINNSRQAEATQLTQLLNNVFYRNQPLMKNIESGSNISKLKTNKIFNLQIFRKISPKNLLFIPIRLIIFPFIKKFNKHSFNINIQYHRWMMGDKLVTKGFFYLHPTAKILGDKGGGSLLSYGLHVGDYSQINISTPKGYLLGAKDVVINKFCHLNIWGKVKIGNNVLFNNYCSLNCLNEITIGDNTWFGEGVRLYDHNHQFKDRLKPFTEQGFSTGKITIGNNVWVGSNCVILQNVSIGDNCVIGANNLIFKSVPPNTIVKSKGMEIMEAIK